MHILVIRPGAIGDTLLTLPVIQALRKQYHPSHITLVGNAVVLPLAHAAGIVDEFYDYEEARWSHLFLTETSRRGRDGKLDTILKRTQLAICWLHDRDGVVEWNLRVAGIQHVIVAPGRPDPTNSEAIHITTYLAQTISPVLKKLPHDISLSPFAMAQRRGITQSQHEEKAFVRPVALHPGSGGERKCWPIECFAEVIYGLWKQNRVVLLLAGPAERERLRTLLGLLHACPQAGRYELLVDAPLLTVAQRLQQCQCYIGNDSGLTHMAAMLDLPTLALFGPSDPVIWHPLGASVTMLHEPKLEQLSVETVMAKLMALLI